MNLPMPPAGLVLAAGAGRRWNEDAPAGAASPKVLLREATGASLLERAVRTLADGGCRPVVVVTGAWREEVEAEVDRLRRSTGLGEQLMEVYCRQWGQGMGSSLRTGLQSLADGPWLAAVVTLADLTGQASPVVCRLLESCPADATALARVTHRGRPGHPVLLGREHWQAACDVAHGDQGARRLLRAAGALEVECGDLVSGDDVDRRQDVAPPSPSRQDAGEVLP